MKHFTDSVIDILKNDLNRMYACKLADNLDFNDIKFRSQKHTSTELTYLIAWLQVPQFRLTIEKSTKEERNINFSIGRKDNMEINLDDSSFQKFIVNRMRQELIKKYGC
jgi:hypothetical protein